jgi:hypothetical protein
MHTKKKAWLVIVLLTVIIKIFSFFPVAIERYYSSGLYPLISRTLRFLFGWMPFSVGDILYILTGLFLVWKLCRLIHALIQKRTGRAFWWNGVRWLAFYCLFIYCLFNILWGLNYNRPGMAYQVGLEMKPYSTDDLQQLVKVLITRLDSTSLPALPRRNQYANHRPLFRESVSCYDNAKTIGPYLSYATESVKPSLFSYLGDYLGYLGYYNPFTGEAQVNMAVPVFVLPFTACHEMGHQLGYAKENEANFAGYLSAKTSADPAFRYSVYFELYSYGIRELYRRDSLTALALNKQKPLQVKTDMAVLREFYNKYENPVEPYIRLLYGNYLRANEQPSGMQSYNEVMAFLIAYYKKYGAAAL